MTGKATTRARKPGPGASATVQPVLDAIARTAARLCEAHDAMILEDQGDAVRHVAKYGRLRAVRDVGEPFPLSRDWVGGRAMIDRKTVHVRDITRSAEFPASRGAGRVTRARTFLAMPLLRNGMALGAILIRRTRVRPFTPRQIALLKTFADQAAIAIENARLSRELEERNGTLTEALGQQTATSEILRVMSSSPTDVQPVFETILSNATRLCEASFAALFSYDGNVLTAVAHQNAPPEMVERFKTFRSPPGPDGPMRRAALERRTIHIPDLMSDPSIKPILFTGGVVRTVVAVPLLRDDRLVGVIEIWRREVRPFSDKQIELVATFAEQAVIAIENVRLFKELQSSNSELRTALERQTATSEILRVISSSPTDIEPVLAAVAESAARLCRSVDCNIFRLDGDRLVLVARHGPIPTGVVGEFTLPLVRGSLAGRTALERRMIHVADIQAEAEEYPDAAPARTFGLRTMLSVPLLREDATLGVIQLRRTEVSPFTDRQAELLQTFADQAVIAIENVRLFKELQSRNRDLAEALDQQTATSEILRVISSSPTDLQPVFDTIAASATRLCDALFGLVFRFDGTMITLVAHDSATPDQLTAIRGVYPMPPGGPSVAARAIHERRVIAIADSQTSLEYPHIAERARAIGYRSLVSVPMLRGDGAIGAINIVRAEVIPFTESQIELLKTFADQAVIAIENVRLFKALEVRNRDLTEALDTQTATAEILRVISGSPTDVQPVFDAIVAAGQRLIGGFSCALRLLEGETLRLAAFTSTGPVGDEAITSIAVISRDAGLTGRVVRERAPAFIADVQADASLTPRNRETARARGYRSVLSVPLLREGGVIGVINATRTGPGPFSPSEIALLQTFADQAVIAIENVRLVSELQGRTSQLARSVDELTALGEVSRALSSTLDLEAVLNTIVARANQLAGTDSCSVWEYDEGTETFSLRATDNPDQDVVAVLRRTSIAKGEGAVGRVATTHAPIQIPDVAAEEAYRGSMRDVIVRMGTRALLAVPLLHDDHLVGGLTVNRKTPGEFPPEVVELLKTFATQSALAINNARLFREIEEKGRQLEIASQHKSQFLANMSHELRTPLNAILGYTELITDNIYGEVPERMREVLERVDKSGRHLLGLINDILDLSKIEAGQLTLALGPYSMDGVAQTVATQVGALAAEKRLDFELVLAEDVPIGQGDERRLTQVLLNLVGNAIKFTDAGRVVVRVEAAGRDYLVSVTDTGPGIAEADREKIFEEFQQADTTRAKAKGGTGLGLAISRRIVEMHGGRLWVESTLGEGSTFSFTVPVHVDRQVSPSRAGAPA